MFPRITGSPVLRDGRVGIVRCAAVRGDCNVFDDGTEADGIPDDGFVLARQIDALGVAATFYVEDGTRAPTMLIIPDQKSVRVCRERCLARS